MTFTIKTIAQTAALLGAGFVLGRLSARAIGNLLLGGTMFGGDFL